MTRRPNTHVAITGRDAQRRLEQVSAAKDSPGGGLAAIRARNHEKRGHMSDQRDRLEPSDECSRPGYSPFGSNPKNGIHTWGDGLDGPGNQHEALEMTMSGIGGSGYTMPEGDLEALRAEANATVERQQREQAEREAYEARTGAARIAAERRRQITAEGWSPEHDAEHVNGDLRDAAIAYLMATDDRAGDNAIDVWPWDVSWWKPKDAISNLVRAGALIAAEIDRLQYGQPL
jgi:hypothetical protein